MPLTISQETTIHKHNLDVKFDEQLSAMRTSHAAKLATLRVPNGDLDKLSDPDGIAAVRWELKEQGLTSAEITKEITEQQAYYAWKEAILGEIVTHIDLEVAARLAGGIVRTPR